MLEVIPRRILLHVPDDTLLAAGADASNAPRIRHKLLRPGKLKAMFAQVGYATLLPVFSFTPPPPPASHAGM